MYFQIIFLIRYFKIWRFVENKSSIDGRGLHKNARGRISKRDLMHVSHAQWTLQGSRINQIHHFCPSDFCHVLIRIKHTVFAEINAHPEISAHQKQWFFKGGSTQNQWVLMDDFSKGGVHKTDGFLWVVFQRGEYTKPMGFEGFWNFFYWFRKLSARGVYFGKYGNQVKNILTHIHRKSELDYMLKRCTFYGETRDTGSRTIGHHAAAATEWEDDAFVSGVFDVKQFPSWSKIQNVFGLKCNFEWKNCKHEGEEEWVSWGGGQDVTRPFKMVRVRVGTAQTSLQTPTTLSSCFSRHGAPWALEMRRDWSWGTKDFSKKISWKKRVGEGSRRSLRRTTHDNLMSPSKRSVNPSLIGKEGKTFPSTFPRYLSGRMMREKTQRVLVRFESKLWRFHFDQSINRSISWTIHSGIFWVAVTFLFEVKTSQGHFLSWNFQFGFKMECENGVWKVACKV